MNYVRSTIRSSIDKLLRDKKTLYSLPNYETLKDIFIELQDDKIFFINVINDLYSTESDSLTFVINDLESDELPEELSIDNFFAPVTMRLVQKRFSVMKEPKILMLSINEHKINDDIRAINEINRLVNLERGIFGDELNRLIRFYNIHNEVERAIEYLGNDIKKVVYDHSNVVIFIMFNSYECREVK